LTRQKALGPVGETLLITNTYTLDVAYTLTLMTTLDINLAVPLAIDLRLNSNTQYDFCRVIANFLEQKYLSEGDVLVMDNWSGHYAEDTVDALLALCRSAGVTIRFMPTYSPELNPCEYVFSLIKCYLRNHRGSEPFWMEILKAAANVTYNHVCNFYWRSIVDFGE